MLFSFYEDLGVIICLSTQSATTVSFPADELYQTASNSLGLNI